MDTDSLSGYAPNLKLCSPGNFTLFALLNNACYYCEVAKIKPECGKAKVLPRKIFKGMRTNRAAVLIAEE